MTEEKWLTATCPTPMWWFIEKHASERKLRLVSCACCRRIWHILSDRRSLEAIRAAESLADGLISKNQASEVLHSGCDEVDGMLRVGGDKVTEYSVARTVLIQSLSAIRAVPTLVAAFVQENHGMLRVEESKNQTTLFRDIFGNPFRLVAAEPAWLTDTVQSIAGAIYQERAFDRMPILADALEEAGCTNADILLHCRQPGEHVRGCWVVDLVLGKQ